MLIGIDVHKRLVNITEMEEDGTIRENYEIENSEESWNKFVERYLSTKPEIAHQCLSAYIPPPGGCEGIESEMSRQSSIHPYCREFAMTD